MMMQEERLTVDDRLLQIARRQFCLDIGMEWEEYEKQPDKKCYICKTTYAKDSSFAAMEGARRYAGTDSFFKAIICMGQLFLSVDEQIYDWAVVKFADCQPQWFCEYGNLRMIDEKLREYQRQIKDTHIYFLPAIKEPDMKPMDLVTVWYEQDDILQFKEANPFTSAICFSPTQPDVLAVAALKEGKVQPTNDNLAGMAGVSEDGRYLWQIGINVVSEYARKGLAVQLVNMLKTEVLQRNKIPFYGTSESHTISQTVGLKAGFAPAWTEIYVEPIE